MFAQSLPSSTFIKHLLRYARAAKRALASSNASAADKSSILDNVKGKGTTANECEQEGSEEGKEKEGGKPEGERHREKKEEGNNAKR